MIQRKQSVFLLLSVILGVLTLSVQFYSWVMFVVLLLAASLNLYTIFLYKKRLVQARFCLFGIVLVFVWYILLAVYQSYVTTIDALPLVDAILIFLARKGILDDEKLVRAADRIR
jgi:hypothetical protein